MNTNLGWFTPGTTILICIAVGLAIAGYFVLAFIEKMWPFKRKKRDTNL